MAINATEEEQIIEINPREIFPYQEFGQDFLSSESEEESASIEDPEERVQRVLSELQLDHLNEEEKQSIETLVKDYPYVFYLPGDMFPCTDLIEYRIPTTDDIPVNVKPFRHAQVHKQIIEDQIQQLLEDSVISPSTSNYNSPIFIIPKKSGKDGKPRHRM